MIKENDIRRLGVFAIVLALGVLVFFLIKPIFFTIFGGMILAYIFYPIYRRLCKRIPNKIAVASIVTFLAIAILIVPIWFITPPLIQQTFKASTAIQNLDLNPLLERFLPTASESMTRQINAAFDSFVSKSTSSVLNSLVGLLIEFPIILLHAFLMAFVFFFVLKDWEKLRGFISDISPLSQKHEDMLVSQFKKITDSILYGQVVVGILQGLVAGIGFWIFGVPNAFILTVLAIVLGIIPVIGPGLVWIPVTIYMFIAGDVVPAILFLAYNTLIVSTIDNVLRTYIIAKRSSISPIILFVGMIGGLLVFGMWGLILGPLILSYFLTFLQAYKEKDLRSLFRSD